MYLRCLTSIEMFSLSSYYANHPIIYGHSMHGKPVNENTIFSIAISQIAYQSFQKDDRIPAVIVEAVNVAKNYTYSSFLSLLALSSVIGRPIESYYPIHIESDTPANIYETMFNCTVSPRRLELLEEIPLQHRNNVHIFRCASAPMDYISTTKLSPTKNHFVSLMQVDTKDTTFILPLSFVKKHDSIAAKQPSSTATQPSNTTAPVPSKRPSKRKQLSIGHFAAKVSKTATVPSFTSTVDGHGENERSTSTSKSATSATSTVL